MKHSMLPIVLMLTFAGAGVVLAQEPHIARSVLANGGTVATGGAHRVRATLGQAVIGPSSTSGRELCSGFWCVAGAGIVGVDPGNEPPPRVLRLGSPYPNPAATGVRFAVELPVAGVVSLEVFDSGGRRICSLARGEQPAGLHAWSWDLQDASGRRVAAGQYFGRLTVNGRPLASRRVSVLR